MSVGLGVVAGAAAAVVAVAVVGLRISAHWSDGREFGGLGFSRK